MSNIEFTMMETRYYCRNDFEVTREDYILHSGEINQVLLATEWGYIN